ncbi:hypothetical protein [Mucisphaera calidilacus]|uniref:Uncharacterized protein n=1 Tax=Mucisphaera calidilacus TaxID=2527982 RepID=A0A518C0Q5_9BACT|nr:hypothetical protein [Mucisphaera calidilacus]QDU72809.1 hypothetical protein Pan265_26830 [Mucisphaera calidilacus]
MSEWSPEDRVLLAQVEDAATGVPYIETGRSPYYAEFRRMVERLARVAERGNDLRVYRDGLLSVGVRGGRCRVAGACHEVASVAGMAVVGHGLTRVWVDASGEVRVSVDAFPEDRSAHLRLAEVFAEEGAVVSITDLRGETQLQSVDASVLGLTATVAELDRVVAGVDAGVTSSALGVLCGGPMSVADAYHGHAGYQSDEDAEVSFTVRNASSGSAAGVMLSLSLPAWLSEPTRLRVRREGGWLEQEVGGTGYALVGGVPLALVLPGVLTGSVVDRLVGVVPCDGTVAGVVLSVGRHLQTSEVLDGLEVSLRVNGRLLTDTPARLRVSDGVSNLCTDAGDGEAALMFEDSVCAVSRGELVTATITRTASGVVSQEAEDVAVLVLMRSGRVI